MPNLESLWPSVPRAVLALLKREMTGRIEVVVGSWPADATQRTIATGALPQVRLAGLGSTNDGTTKRETLDVDILTPKYATSERLAGQIEQLMMAYPHRVGLDDTVAYLDYVSTTMGPQEVPWSDPNVRRFIASYRISVRR